jgi:23S rRNA (pseudouridine1915-N3)-methyltransferase
MKFSDISKEEWTGLQPYLDTCLIPVTGLQGTEQPWEATVALEKLRDALEIIEIPYKGRVITYPALHYVKGTNIEHQIAELCSQLKATGFAYVIILSIHNEAQHWTKEAADEIFYINMNEWSSSYPEIKSRVSQQLQQLWRKTQ